MNSLNDMDFLFPNIKLKAYQHKSLSEIQNYHLQERKVVEPNRGL